VTPTQIELARHALGLTNGRRVSYRNHFVAGPGHSDFDDWSAMAAAGDARTLADSPLSGGDLVFWLTRQGAEKALRHGERLDPHDFPESPK
jgi:hypothetical protein